MIISHRHTASAFGGGAVVEGGLSEPRQLRFGVAVPPQQLGFLPAPRHAISHDHGLIATASALPSACLRIYKGGGRFEEGEGQKGKVKTRCNDTPQLLL